MYQFALPDGNPENRNDMFINVTNHDCPRGSWAVVCHLWVPGSRKMLATEEVQKHKLKSTWAVFVPCLSLFYSFFSDSHTSLHIHKGRPGSREMSHFPPLTLFMRTKYCSYLQFYISLCAALIFKKHFLCVDCQKAEAARSKEYTSLAALLSAMQFPKQLDKHKRWRKGGWLWGHKSSHTKRDKRDSKKRHTL